MHLGVLLISAAIANLTGALKCLEGQDCIEDASCTACEGIACTRIESRDPEDNSRVALTCIPNDARFVAYERPEGCVHTANNKLLCTCFDDYCNAEGSSRSSILQSIPFFLLGVVIAFFHL
ncbi:hypothetical protein PFISCL1PPCAC_2105 [Pristionchus fissidentatus]|uniref:Protein sleepless n=1 Tax=Pristionchus fissidentatus TaxID=1538716 RepID=A0AAV5UX63_9BILA|nr:hypothetical protein PFISCL1PPCAC_2105 [Pristionchus fissidentatus]